MHSSTDTQRDALRQRLRDEAVARAQALRRQAMADFWSDLAQQLGAALARWQGTGAARCRADA